MSSSFNDCKAKSTKTITSSLNKDKLLCINSTQFWTNILNFRFWNLFLLNCLSFFWRKGSVHFIWVFTKNNNSSFELIKFWIEFKKVFLSSSIFKCSTTTDKHFFVLRKFFETIFYKFNPLSLSIICYHTASNKNTFFIFQLLWIQPFICIVFIYLTPKNFIFH